MSLSKRSSPLNSLIQDDPDTPNIKALRQSAIDFLKTESLVLSARDHKTPRDFVPFVNERDQLGNLLSKKRKKIQLPFVSKVPNTNSKRAVLEQLTYIPDEWQGQDFNFDNFRYQPILTQSSSKSAIKALLKPLDIKETMHNTMSQCFLTPGRKGPPPEKSPGVGYYHIKDNLVYPNNKKVVFVKENKVRSLSNNTKQNISEIDPVKCYDKLHQKSVYVPDFMKSTTRSNHYYNKVLHYPEDGKNTQIYNYEDIIAKGPNAIKEPSPDVEPKWRFRDYEYDNNLPINTANMIEKFRQIKKKYLVKRG